jgi:hypothetical protein
MYEFVTEPNEFTIAKISFISSLLLNIQILVNHTSSKTDIKRLLTFGVCPFTLPARAREPWTLPDKMQ